MQAARGASLSPSGPNHPSGRRPDRKRFFVVFGAVALFGYVTDLTTKLLAVEHLSDREPISIIGDFFTLTLARNPGAAFSTGTSYTLALSVVAIAASIGVIWVARRLGSIGWAVGLGFLLAGVLGNLTDRIFRSPGVLRGHVVDFLSFSSFPIFNVADMCINVAAALVIIQAFRGISVNGQRHDADDDTRSSETPLA